MLYLVYYVFIMEVKVNVCVFNWVWENIKKCRMGGVYGKGIEDFKYIGVVRYFFEVLDKILRIVWKVFLDLF